MSMSVFHRSALAEKMAQQVLATGVGVSSSSGLFLAAPRRTGKSTFMREDLRPSLSKAGAVVIYVDLWANKQADPGDLIASAIRDELSKHDGVVKRLSKSAGIDKVNLAGIGISWSHASLGKDVALSAALAALSDEVKAPIALLIDEAQHAITTDAGFAALFALKAARDELNSSAHFGLRIVATGSNRDKLAMLRNSKDQAFFGAPLVPFPPLGKDFVAWFCEGVGLSAQLEVDMVYRLFEQAAFRPELLAAAADHVRFDFALESNMVSEAFVKAVQGQIEMADAQTMRVIDALTPLQSSVLRVMAAKAEKYAPFDEAAMNSYAAVIKKIAPAETLVPDVSNVQQALAALQDKGLVWREKRGVYALEESTTAELLRSSGFLDGL
jgi:hypothetical protein